MTWSNRREVWTKAVGIAVVVVVTLATYWLTGSETEEPSTGSAGTPGAAASPSPSPSPEGDAASYDPVSGLDYVEVADLPDEAVEVLAVIDEGGPYAYDQDDSTFGNREGILPQEPMGYYREYTVDTPGSDDRGARRIVAGEEGERYYTDDHYDSFRVVRE